MNDFRIFFRNISWFGIIGAGTSLLQGSLFTYFIKHISLHTLILNSIAFWICVPVNYLFNSHLTWQDRKSPGEHRFNRFPRFICQSFVTWVLNQVGFFLADAFFASEIAVWIGIAISASTGFILSDRLTFAKRIILLEVEHWQSQQEA